MATTTETLSLIVEAQDRASTTLDRISGAIKRLGGVAGTITGALANFGGQVLNRMLGSVLQLSEGILKLGASTVLAGSDAEEMQGKFDAVFRDLAGPVTDKLEIFAKQVGRNKFELMGFAATLQDTFVPLGFARDEAASMSTQLVKLAVDLASFNNVSEDIVVRDLQSALVGNTETLRKYGVVATIAAIKQFALNNGIWGGEAAFTAQMKAAAIMGLTIAATTDAQGDALRTAGGFANQMRALKSTLEETRTEIGQKLLPVFTPLVSKFLELAQDGGPKLVRLFESDVIPALIKVRDALISVIDNGFNPWILFIRNVDAQLVEFVQRMRGFFSGQWLTSDLIEQVNNLIRESFESNFGSIEDIINDAKAAFLKLSSTWRIIAPIAAGVAIVLGAISAPITAISLVVAALGVAWLNNWGGIRDKTEEVMAVLKPLFEDLKEKVLDLVERGLVILKNWWDENGPFMQAVATAIFIAIKDAIDDLSEKVIPFLLRMVEKISTWFSENGPLMQDTIIVLAGFFTEVLLPAIVGFWDIVEPILSTMLDFLLNIVEAIMLIITTGSLEGFTPTEDTHPLARLAARENQSGNQQGISQAGSSSREQNAASGLSINTVNINNGMDEAQFRGMLRQELFG